MTSVEALPNYRLDGSPVSIRDIPRERKWQLIGDPLFWHHAKRLADELASRNPGDERIAPLRTFANDHKFTRHKGAFTELGRRLWQGERGPTDKGFKGVLYPCADIESTGGWEHQRHCMGWIYKGMGEAAAEEGVSIVPLTYGQWTFSVGAFWESMRQGGKGDPEYLLPERDYFAAPDPTLRACNELHGVLPMDGYLQALWGREPFYKRNPDGSLKHVDGRPAFNDIDKTTSYGVELRLEPGEAEHCLNDLYRQAVRMYLMHHRLAGQYPAHSGLRKEFLKNMRIGAWTRYTNEGLQGIQQNDRPLPGWLIETLVGLYLFTADDIVAWSSDMNHPPGPPGADYTRTWKYNAHGVVEHVIKAAHRYSALDPLHKAEGAFQWCWFRLPVVNKNQSDGDRYTQKPIVFGKIRTFEKKPWMEVFAAWPALDGRPASFKLWADKDGKRSPAYTLQLADGRSYFYDAWQLPETLTGLEGKHIWLRFTDLMGETRTWRGDWREPADNSVAPPPDHAGSER